MPTYQLLIWRGVSQVGSYALGSQVTVLGRLKGNTITLDDPSLSRRHAELRPGPGGCWTLADLGSKNGTFIEGARVQTAALTVGDAFRIGAFSCQIMEQSPSPHTKRLAPETVTAIIGAEALLGNDAGFLAASTKTLAMLSEVAKLAAAPVNVLITGESGTGKSLIAKMIHDASPRKAHAFIPVNCAAIPVELIESELFGHKKGAFTGAVDNRDGKFKAADGGTLFLDEVGDLSLPGQAKILRAIEEQQIEQIGNPRPINVDVRVISATNKPLKEEIGAGRFREDLFYRLATVQLRVPPLRERLEDIPHLATHFLSTIAERMPGAESVTFTTAALSALQRYPWPGNVRELRNVVSRAVVLRSEEAITPEDLRLEFDDVLSPSPQPTPPASDLRHQEARHIEAVLTQHHWNISHASEALGIARKTLRKRIRDYGLTRPTS